MSLDTPSLYENLIRSDVLKGIKGTSLPSFPRNYGNDSPSASVLSYIEFNLSAYFSSSPNSPLGRAFPINLTEHIKKVSPLEFERLSIGTPLLPIPCIL